MIGIFSYMLGNVRFYLSSTDPPNPVYSINGVPTPLSDQYHDLGLLVNNRLTWTNHIDKTLLYGISLCSKAYLSLHLICRTVSPSSPVWIRKQLYISLIRSHLGYCSQLWRPVLVKDIQSLEQFQHTISFRLLSSAMEASTG